MAGAVEYDVPCPPPGNRGPRTELGRKVHAMKVGGCLPCESADELDRARYLARGYGYSVTVRKCELRMWRTA